MRQVLYNVKNSNMAYCIESWGLAFHRFELYKSNKNNKLLTTHSQQHHFFVNSHLTIYPNKDFKIAILAPSITFYNPFLTTSFFKES